MRRGSVLVAVVALLLAGACGVPSDGSPQAIPERDLPSDLLDPNPGSSTTLPESAGTTTVEVYLLEETPDGLRLVAAEREVTDAEVPNERLAALFGGATSAETELGITTGIPADTVLLDVTTDADAREVHVDLSDDIFTIEGEALAQAFAQIVYTATEPGSGGFRGVRFSVDGEPTPVLDGDSNEIQGPATRADYLEFAPRPGA